MPMISKAILLCAICFVVCSCTAREDGASPAEVVSTQDLYAQYKNHMEAQLNKGRSWLQPDWTVVAELAGRVSSNKEFFRRQVLDDFFVAAYVLRESELAKKNAKRLKGIDAEARKQVWLKLLSPDRSQ